MKLISYLLFCVFFHTDFNASEGIQPEISVGMVMATDADNLPPIIYGYISPATPFDVDPNSGSIFLRNGESLDRENM